MAAGKAIISQAPMSVPKGVPDPPYLGIDGEDGRDRAGKLAIAIRELADDPALRRALGARAEAYYDRYLSRDALIERWTNLLRSA